jgi:acyl-CoA thioesterase
MNRADADALYAKDTACKSLGITIDEVGPGSAVLRMRVTEVMANSHGRAHDGYLFLLADAAFAYAGNVTSQASLAQSAQVTFLNPAVVGDVLLAEAREQDVTVSRNGAGIIAEFHGHGVTVVSPPALTARIPCGMV